MLNLYWSTTTDVECLRKYSKTSRGTYRNNEVFDHQNLSFEMLLFPITTTLQVYTFMKNTPSCYKNTTAEGIVVANSCRVSRFRPIILEKTFLFTSEGCKHLLLSNTGEMNITLWKNLISQSFEHHH